MKRAEMYKFYIRHLYRSIKNFLKWGIFSSVVGVVVGAFSTLFAFCLKQVTQIRTDNPWIFLFLPLAGILIVLLLYIDIVTAKSRGVLQNALRVLRMA